MLRNNALFALSGANKSEKKKELNNRTKLKAFLIFDTFLILVFNYFAFFP